MRLEETLHRSMEYCLGARMRAGGGGPLVIRLQSMLQTCGSAPPSELRLTGRLRSTVTRRGEPRRPDLR